MSSTSPLQTALGVFFEILRLFDPQPAWKWDGHGAPEHCPNALCERLCAVGSVQRRAPQIEVLELLVCPRAVHEANLTEELIARLVRERIIEPGSIWSPLCKHARHVETGLPVIFHFTSAAAYSERLKELEQFEAIRNYGQMERKAA